MDYTRFSWFSQVVYLDIYVIKDTMSETEQPILDKERASDDQKVHIKLAYRVLVE